jgi:hypothetical protein
MYRRTRLLIVGFSVMVAAGAALAAQPQNRADAVLVLTQSGDTCGWALTGNDTDPAAKDRLRARRGGAIRWTVTNNCTTETSVTLDHWRRKSDDSDAAGFFPNGRLSCNVNAGRQCMLTVTVHPNAPAGTYSYDVTIGGVVYDPDVVIEG